ncbi:MAG TPA: hypothetical protein VGN12_28415 [Pirellulales bacterium]|jgi:hypothetical protein
MIVNAYVLPTERPPSLLSIKRALLSYDQIVLRAPNDRELIPSHFFQSAVTGLPPMFAMGGGPAVRPLGKVHDFDKQFDQLLEQCSPAGRSGNITVLSAHAPFQGVALGMMRPPDGVPDPIQVYQQYRLLAVNPQLLNSVCSGVPFSDFSSDIVLDSADDSVTEHFLNGEQMPGPPPFALYPGEANSDEDRVWRTRLALGRLGAFVRSLAECDMRGLQPYTSDPGYAMTLRKMNEITKAACENQTEDADGSRSHGMLLARLHNVMISHYVSEDILESMSVSDVMRLRTKAWGTAGEARAKLPSVLREIALENPTPSTFEKVCKARIDEYLRDCMDVRHEWKKLGADFVMKSGSVVYGQQMVDNLFGGFSTFNLYTLIAGLYAAGFYIPKIMDVLKKDAQANTSVGYSLHRTYAPFTG